MAGLDPSPPGRPTAKYNGSASDSEDRARRRAGALRSWTESGRLPYWPRGPPACSIDLDFLGPSRFCPSTARKQGLDFLGFPWILSSESRLFNGLRGILREKNFARSFAARQPAATGAGVLTMQKRSVAHRTSLTRFLLFCNQCRPRNCRFSVEPPTGRFVGSSSVSSDNRAFPNIGQNESSLATSASVWASN
jgi:hypothetical protein